MRHAHVALFVTLAIAAATVDAAAQNPGTLVLYSDTEGLNCLVSDIKPGPIILYLHHQHTAGVTAVQFRVATDEGFTGAFLSSTVAPGFLDWGSPPDDYAVSYGGCIPGSFLVTTLVYIGFGASESCSHIEIGAGSTSPIPGEIAVIDCDFEVVAGRTVGPAVVNYHDGCPGGA